MRLLLALSWALLLTACPPQGPVVVVPPDADAAPAPAPSACAAACARLAAAGCPEVADNCPEVLQGWTDHLAKKNPRTGRAWECADLAAAVTVAAIRANGFRCLTDRDAQ